MAKTGTVLLFLAMLLAGTSFSQSQQQEEVLLAFRHPAIGNVYINSYYDYSNKQIFLPIVELFSLMEINFQSDTKSFALSGNYISQNNPYSINLQTMQIILGKNSYQLSPDDFRIGYMDFYLNPAVFEKVFGLNFTVSIMHLTMSLETNYNLPIQERQAREKARSRMEESYTMREDFPLEYDRKRNVLGGAMIDYSLNANVSEQAQNFGYNFTGGAEVLGGDLQGSINGFTDNFGNSVLNTSGVRWRYAVRDNNYFSGLTVGQMSTSGLQPMYIKGVAISNDPIEPRHMYETYLIDGNTEPESEVEIYINERLTDYKRADELGYYRFNVPVTYGTTRVSLRIYTPSGELSIVDKQLQVPFTFLPRGVVSYNLQAGLSEYAWADSLQDQYVAHGNIAYGLSKWLTASAGAQHMGDKTNPVDMFYYGTLSARIAQQYLFSLDAAPDAFYRLTGSVMYTNNLSLNFIYTKFDGNGIFNPRNAIEEISSNIYLPFTIFGASAGMRFSGEHSRLPFGSNTRYRTDLNTRLGRINLRLNYRDNMFSSNESNYFGEGLLTSALTYTISRSPGLPLYVRGMFVRAQAQYNVRQNVMQTGEIQLSRTVMKTGRLNLGATYNLQIKTLYAQMGLTLDLNKVRSTTSVNTINENVTVRQSLTGNIGFDAPNQKLILSNRQQVGQAAAAIIQYVDNNNSGKYDSGDERLPYRGVNIDRTTNMVVGSDSILRLNQLQSYYLYNLSVNRNAIPDPTLVPLRNEFSFIADPNQYKQIEIPFYRGGIVEGTVLIERSGEQYGQGGLRILVQGKNNAFEQTVRSFNDGGFYLMDIPPGIYNVSVDSAQLGFLNVKQIKPVEFEIKVLAEGDYIEGIEILLKDGE